MTKLTCPTRIKVAGHLCLDITPPLDGDLPAPGALHQVGAADLRSGGCVANTGLALASLGAHIELDALVGDDPFGDVLDALLRREATRQSAASVVSLTRIREHATSYSIVLQPIGGDRRFLHHVGSNEAFDGRGVGLDGVGLVHIGYPTLLPRLIEDGGAPLQMMLERARAQRITTSVDLATIDPQDTGSTWRELIEGWAPSIDIFSPSLDDLSPLYPEADAEPLRAAARIADALVASGVAVALVTAGAAGMALATGTSARLAAAGIAFPDVSEWFDRRMSVRTPPVAVVRTTGAGDTASAALLYGITRGHDPVAALRLVASAAALHVTGTVHVRDDSSSDYTEAAARILGEEWQTGLVVNDQPGNGST